MKPLLRNRFVARSFAFFSKHLFLFCGLHSQFDVMSNTNSSVQNQTQIQRGKNIFFSWEWISYFFFFLETRLLPFFGILQIWAINFTPAAGDKIVLLLSFPSDNPRYATLKYWGERNKFLQMFFFPLTLLVMLISYTHERKITRVITIFCIFISFIILQDQLILSSWIELEFDLVHKIIQKLHT